MEEVLSSLNEYAPSGKDGRAGEIVLSPGKAHATWELKFTVPLHDPEALKFVGPVMVNFKLPETLLLNKYLK